MTWSNSLKPLGFILAGAALGWILGRKNGSGVGNVIDFNEHAAAVQVLGRSYALSDLPIAQQHRVYAAYMQANGQLKTALEEFAARVSLGNGKYADEPSWNAAVEKRIAPAEIEKVYNFALGFKQMGPLSDPKVQKAVMTYLRQREQSAVVFEEIGKLKKENALQMLWNLPLAPAIEGDTSAYPVIEVGSAGDVFEQELQVIFSYAQSNSESAFFILSQAAENLKRRFRVRLLIEANDAPKVKAAFALVNCLAGKDEFKREAWLVHARLTQEIFRLPDSTAELPISQFFPGDAGLVERIRSCPGKPIDPQKWEADTENWAGLRTHPYPIVFLAKQRISDADPRGLEGVLTQKVTAKNR